MIKMSVFVYCIKSLAEDPCFNHVKKFIQCISKEVKGRHSLSWIYRGSFVHAMFKHVLRFLQQFLTSSRLKNDQITNPSREFELN